MHERPSSPVRPLAGIRLGLFCLVIALQPTPAHALSLVEVCRSTDSLLVCRLKSVLAMLYTAAGILALLLFIAIAAAIIIYRRNSRKLKTKDITLDAD